MIHGFGQLHLGQLELDSSKIFEQPLIDESNDNIEELSDDDEDKDTEKSKSAIDSNSEFDEQPEEITDGNGNFSLFPSVTTGYKSNKLLDQQPVVNLHLLQVFCIDLFYESYQLYT